MVKKLNGNIVNKSIYLRPANVNLLNPFNRLTY